MSSLNYQNSIVERLKKAKHSNKLFHSYIFSGSKHSGRYEVAIYLAKLLLNDENDVRESDYKHSNLFVVESDKSSISKNQVLEINYEMNTSAIESGAKVFIVEDAHKLNTVAQNSLLKIIEEPQGISYVIFLVENEYQLLNTIISRSQVIKFLPISFDSVYAAVEKDFDDKRRLKYSLYLDNQNYHELYEDEKVEKYIEVVEKYLQSYFSGKSNKVFLNDEIVYSSFKKREELRNVINLIIINLDTILNYKLGVVDELFDNAFEKYVNQDENKIIEAINLLFSCIDMLDMNVNPMLAFDVMTCQRR